MALIVRNSRAPDERTGDLRAQLAATALGTRRVEALAERFGVEGLRGRFAALLDHGERVVRAVLREIPDGRYQFEDRLEVGAEGLVIRLAVEIAGDGVHFDFTGTDPETDEASLNAVAAVTQSACYYTVRCLAGARPLRTTRAATVPCASRCRSAPSSPPDRRARSRPATSRRRSASPTSRSGRWRRRSPIASPPPRAAR